MAHDTPPRWDRKMQQRLSRGEAAALGELYDQFAVLVHGLAHRVLEDEDEADAVTREIFARIWEHPERFDPRKGSMRSWIAGLTQELSVQRLRRHRSADRPAEVVEQQVAAASAAARADYIRNSMPASLRAALELAYIHRRDYRQTALQLGVTEDEARRRLRLGLQLLSTAASGALPALGRPGLGSER
ncbi:sigma-70 family RNA polymerase sigma factor [Streptomyces durbertensis]|uniref:Sigma-70 family RNA polymerase sigma factor n=1 Tax=Streptomyces durbertensis TaxID=2448886 RepID=A0ABR6EJ68_9ACTN|nr:sigma-70 family RNA polymerase sigma factor [Streptomyces durbertensis]MBB1244544.1 sigma-70 family RNA polymerase sigma factor [Streptomyces durbertensis]